MEDIKNVNEIEEVETEENYVEPADDSNEGNLVKVMIGVGSAVVGLIGLAYVNRRKIEEWRINHWKKKGYVIYKEEDLEPYYEKTTDEEAE